MDNKTYAIGILTLTAVALLIANLFAPRPVIAIEAVSNDQMQAVTCRAQTGGDALYLLDQNSGKMAVFTVQTRGGLKLMTVADVRRSHRTAIPLKTVAAERGYRRTLDSQSSARRQLCRPGRARTESQGREVGPMLVLT